MKNLSIMAVMTMLVVTAFISCKKETTESNPITKQTAKQDDSLVIDSVIYYDSRNNLINVNSINQSLKYCLLVEPVSSHVARATYFPSERDFYSFISNDVKYIEVKNRMDFIIKIRDLCSEYDVDLESDAYPPQEIEDYINSWNDSPTMRTAKTTGSGILWEHYVHPNGGGATSGFAIYPRYTLGGFRNRASYVELAGITMLYDKRWFGGASVVVFGFPWGKIPLVPQYGLNFNDRAESLF